MAHVGDVHHPVHIIASPAEELLQHVLHDIAAQVADVGEVVHGGAAGVHLHAGRECGCLNSSFLWVAELYRYISTDSFYVSEPADSSRRLLRYCSSMSFSKNSSRDRGCIQLFLLPGPVTLDLVHARRRRWRPFPRRLRTTWAGTPTAVAVLRHLAEDHGVGGDAGVVPHREGAQHLGAGRTPSHCCPGWGGACPGPCRCRPG